MNGRLERLRDRLDGLGAATFLVSDPVNVRYLTGFESSNAALLVRRERTLLLTDGRYIEAARAAPGVEPVETARNLSADLGSRLGELAEPPVAFEAEYVTVSQYRALGAGGLELVPATSVLEELRAVKDAGELATIRAAAGALVRGFERLAGEELVGRTEAELAWWIERAIRSDGADAVSFQPIVASGPNAARPHHRPGRRPIERGETVIVDAGAKVDGYCSDCTRTFATGPLPEELGRAYELCRAVQEAALAAVRPGAEARAVDAIAREGIERSGLAEVRHGLGHGIGLEVHELPVLSDASDAVLAPGNVVTVEPGVYLPGRGGVRIEDLVIVTDTGTEVLTPFTKDLVTATSL